MADIEGVELARPGEFNLSTGPITLTEQHLQDAAEFASLPGARPGPISLGHVDPRNDGEPAFGWVTNVRVDNDDAGPVLKGDLIGMPEWLVAASKTAFPDRSINGYQNFEFGDRQYGLVVSGLSLLGVTPPGMPSIASWRDLPQALGLAASNAAAATPLEFPPVTASGVPAPQSPAASAVGPSNTQEGSPTVEFTDEQLTTLRQRLGIAEDADGAAFVAALDEALAEQVESPPAPLELPDGVAVIDSQELEDLRVAASAGATARTVQLDQERNQIVAAAVADGRVPPARRDHWLEQLKADPGAKEVLAALAPGLVNVQASGYTGGTETSEDDALYERLYGKEATV